MNPIRAYFDKAVMKYNRGDILALLGAKLPCAGPILNIVMDGVDMLGGMCYGFGTGPGSKMRSVDFLVQEMKLPKEQAELLYSVVRCGITHEGMPKIGISFFAEYSRHEPGKAFYVYQNDDEIYLNVVELAYLYLGTLDRIDKDWAAHLHAYPTPQPINKKLFDDAKRSISDDIGTLAEKMEQSKQNELARAGKLWEIQSSSACSPLNTFNLFPIP